MVAWSICWARRLSSRHEVELLRRGDDSRTAWPARYSQGRANDSIIAQQRSARAAPVVTSTG